MLHNPKNDEDVFSIKMIPSEWEMIPDHPRQRDTEKRIKKARHLINPSKDQHIVKMAILPDGRKYKLDGHTRCLLWSTGRLNPPSLLNVNVIRCDSYDEMLVLYTHSDSREAVETPLDRMTGAYRENDVEFKSSLLNGARIGSALRDADLTVYGYEFARYGNEYERLPRWLDELYLLDSVAPTANKFPTVVLTAALISLARYGDKIIDFWSGYQSGAGEKGKDGADALFLYQTKIREMQLQGRLASGAQKTDVVRITFSAIEAHLDRRTKMRKLMPVSKETADAWCEIAHNNKEKRALYSFK